MEPQMDNDDLPIGRVLNRREVVRLLALGGGAVLIGCDRGGQAEAAAVPGKTTAVGTGPAMPACVVKPELTLGPYFVDNRLDRSDIRGEPGSSATVAGVPIALAFNVSQIDGGSCRPLAGAMVDVWHCDANGVYSSVDDPSAGGDAAKLKFLRGYQVTDSEGAAAFTTIYPGWYRGRAVHIHFKIRTPATAVLAGNDAGVWDFTSQLFFDDELSDRVFSRAPYAGKGNRDRRNSQDGIYRWAGDSLLLALNEDGGGYRSQFDIGLDLSNAETGRADRGGQRGPGGPPPGDPPRR
jgi:protocatechuate 3,4-dioxygenase beta subunit